jgi:hypothetical protein
MRSYTQPLPYYNPSKSPLVRGDLSAMLRSCLSNFLELRFSLPDKGGLGRVIVRRFGGVIMWSILSILFSILAIITHPIAYALPFIAFVWYVIECKPSFKQLFIALLAIVGIIALIEYGMGLHTFTGNLAAHFSLHNNLLYYGTFYLRTYWLFILLGIIGFVLAKKEQRKNLILILIPFFLYLIGISFFTEAIEYRYAFHTTIAFYLMGAFGFVEIIRAIKTSPVPFYNPSKSPLVRGDLSAILKNFLFHPSELRYSLPDKGGMGRVIEREKSRNEHHNVAGDLFRSTAIYAISVVCFVILFISHLVFIPQSFYWLEADDPAKVHNREYYAYTPQPDFNSAYRAIKEQMQPGDIVISSHPHFNKIFLNTAGYWLSYDYLRRGIEVPQNETHELYVNATVIHNLSELQTIMKTHHGFIVYDLQSTDKRIDPSVIDEITNKGTIVFYDERNNYSKIWVYRF